MNQYYIDFIGNDECPERSNYFGEYPEKSLGLCLNRFIAADEGSTTGSPLSYETNNYCISDSLKEEASIYSPKREDLSAYESHNYYQLPAPQKKIFTIVRDQKRERKESHASSCYAKDAMLSNLMNQRGGASNSEDLMTKLVEKSKRILKREIAKNRKKSAAACGGSELQAAFRPIVKTENESPILCFDDKSKKKIQQMIRNRISAQISRDRKKAYIHNLEGENNKLKDENDFLRKKIEELERSGKDPLQKSNELVAESFKLGKTNLKFGVALTAFISIVLMMNMSNSMNKAAETILLTSAEKNANLFQQTLDSCYIDPNLLNGFSKSELINNEGEGLELLGAGNLDKEFINSRSDVKIEEINQARDLKSLNGIPDPEGYSSATLAGELSASYHNHSQKTTMDIEGKFS